MHKPVAGTTQNVHETVHPLEYLYGLNLHFATLQILFYIR